MIQERRRAVQRRKEAMYAAAAEAGVQSLHVMHKRTTHKRRNQKYRGDGFTSHSNVPKMQEEPERMNEGTHRSIKRSTTHTNTGPQ